MNLTGEMIAEAMRKAGMEVQYFPLELRAQNRRPTTMGSENLNLIADVINVMLAEEPAEPGKIDPVHEFYRERAFDTRHKDGDIEFDVDAKVSIGDDAGAYVQAWVWIPGAPPVDSEGGDCD